MKLDPGIHIVITWFSSENRVTLSELDCLLLYFKLSSCTWAHMSGRAGPTNRSAGLLVGRVRLPRTAETMVGGDPWVPMSLTLSSLWTTSQTNGSLPLRMTVPPHT
jgi:hypothetical protein